MTAEEKQRRQQDWQREAEERRRARDVGSMHGQGAWSNYSPAGALSGPPQQNFGAGDGAWQSLPQEAWQAASPYAPQQQPRHNSGLRADAAEFRPPSQQLQESIGRQEDLRFPHHELDDATFARHVQDLTSRVCRSGASPHIAVVDLTGNSLTDEGVNTLCTVARDCSITIGELRLQRNPGIKDPKGVIDLLRDEKVGIGRGHMRCICLSPANTSCEFFWRVLESCSQKRPRPPLVVFLDDELGDLEEVIKMADTYNVKSERFPVLPGNGPPPVDPRPETDVVLFIDQVLKG